MKKTDRQDIARTLARALDGQTALEARRAVLSCKEAFGDLIQDSQGFDAWTEYEAEWRKQMLLPPVSA